MLKLIIKSLLSNKLALLFFSFIIFIIFVFSEESFISLLLIIFITTPLLVSITNKKSLKLSDYHKDLLSVRTIKYSLLLIFSCFVSFASCAIVVYITGVQSLLHISLIATFIFTYTIISPYLISIARGFKIHKQGFKQVLSTSFVVSAYVVINYLLKMVYVEGTPAAAFITFMGGSMLLITFVVITAVSITPDST